MSKRKRKNKVVKLTERDYDNYVMSIKEEEPVHAVKKTVGKYDDTGA
ncbi:MAG: hypothetical protein J6Z34_01875 [Clostridia bacterium]|nr:hypothetical protein [Clostridia bacterium]